MNLRAAMTGVLLASCIACGTAQPCMVQSPAVVTPQTPDHGLDKLSERDLARRMVADMGSKDKDISAQVIDAMLTKFHTMSDLPAGFVERFAANARAARSTMEEQIIEIFVTTYDKATLVASVRFYESPAGRKITAAMPALMEQGMAAGAAWGRDVAAKTLEELRTGSPAK